MTSIFKINGLVVITGAAGLLGEQHAKAVLQHGGSVALIDINKQKLQALKDKLIDYKNENINIFE